MAPSTTPRNRIYEGNYDDDEAPITSAIPMRSISSSKSTKRARLNLNGDASPSTQSLRAPGGYGSGPDDVLQEEFLHSKPCIRKHQPGSIVRVKLANFVTYTAVEFFPGPSLNMVIGPNGTGKSTLVCAICLGLGWGPQHLGRAKDVSEYVKHGCQEATIEIELARDGKRYKKNPVIRCCIKREGNKTHFTLDGKPSNKKGVLDLARSFSIQIDNLCQFLPQDKVVEFAAMTPIELLKSTQRAVAPQEMLDMHESLKLLRKSQKDLQDSQTSDQDTLENLEGRQRIQEADVERMRERQITKDRVRMLEASKPFAEYRDARTKFNEMKDDKKTAIAQLRELELDKEPVLHAVNSKHSYQETIKIVVSERTRAMKRAEQVADGIEQKMKKLNDQAVEFGHSLEAERRGGQKSRQEIIRLDGDIAMLKKQMEEQPPDFEVASYNERIREKNRIIDENGRKIRDLRLKQTELNRRGEEKNVRVNQARKGLKDLESQAGQQKSKLSRLSEDTSRAWDWIQENQGKFEKHIFGPPIVECSVTDPRYVDLVEALFQPNNLLCFTVQTQNDFRKLSEELHQGLRLSEVNIRTMSGTLADFGPPVNADEMKRYGLEGWAVGYLNGPEPVMASLCYDVKLHLTGITLRDSTSEQYDLLANSPIQSWVSSKSTYRINRRREYGPGAVSTSVQQVRRARFWTDQPVDLRAKHELQENIEGWTEEVVSFKREFKEIQESVSRLQADIQEKMEEEKLMQREKAAKQKFLSEFKALPTKLAQKEERLGAAQGLIVALRQLLQDIAVKIDTVAMESAQTALEYANAVEALRKAHDALHEAELMLIEATSDLEILQARNIDVKASLDAKQSEVSEIIRMSNVAQQSARQLLEKCKTLLASDDEALVDFFRGLSERQTLAELDIEIESEKAKLELMHEGNHGVIKEFEQRQKRIDALKAKLEEFKHGLDEFNDKIKEIRDQWEPELDSLVKKISNSFSFNMKQINCAGEVGIFKDEQDFDQWAIQIQVKFRESEPLTTLDSHRQSGGERAVSTIFYLMSLQSLTRSPFRVVDEINQGMDPRNERLVHKRMVDIACGVDEASAPGVSEDEDVNMDKERNGDLGRQGGSQYFLITPKLLHGLAYARGMQVLCIASGEFMPADRMKIDFRGCVDLMRGLKAGGMGVGIVA